MPVISYDRLNRNSAPDLYVSFDNERVGEMQANYLLERAPRGNYILICGSPTDSNARLFRQGQMNVLQPAIERGEIRATEQWARDWLPDEVLKHAENALTRSNNDVAAIFTLNDATAGGAIQALINRISPAKFRFPGKTPILPPCSASSPERKTDFAISAARCRSRRPTRAPRKNRNRRAH